MAAVNFVTDFSAVGNGVTSNTTAINSFNTYYAGAGAGLTTLTIPAGNYAFASPAIWGASGGDRLLILATGATLQNQSGFANSGFANDNTHHANIATVSAGTTTVTLVTGAQTSRFTSGQWVCVAGIDLQGYGYPINPGIFEFKQIASIGSGTLTFTEPLTRGYKSTWPNYAAGDGSNIYQGGPATVYAMDPIWNQECEIRGASFTDTGNQFYGKCRVAAYTDCTWATFGPSPTVSLSTILLRCTVPFSEVDKVVQSLVVQDCAIPAISFTSSSINQLTVSGTNTATSYWRGVAGGSSSISGLTTPEFRFGVGGFGVVTGNTIVSGTTVSAGSDTSYWSPGNNVAFTNYTEEGGGVLSIATVGGDPVTWAIPGGWYGLTDSGSVWSRSFRVTDITASGGRTYVTTTLPYPVPSSFNGRTAPWLICPHPGAHLTVTGSTAGVLTTMSSKPANSPITISGVDWSIDRSVAPLRMRVHA